MEILYPQQYKKNFYTATIGFFDGVHIGHQFVIKQLQTIAKTTGTQSLIVTFSTHPRKTLQSGFQPEILTTLPEKLSLLEKNGVDACAVLDFNSGLAKMSAYDFMNIILKHEYNVNTLLIGYDHRFGYERQETFSDYIQYGKKLGIEIVQTEQFVTDRLYHISSSEIRKSLENGKIEAANAMLGYNYFFEGKVVDGFKVGRKIGFPTANLLPDDKDKLLPSSGVYAVRVNVNEELYCGMLNIGSRPTLNNGNGISIEVHIINFERNIYNQTIALEFIHKIREERKFNNIYELTRQLEKDKQEVLNLMSR